MGLVVRRRFLCSAGKPQNAGWVSRSLLRVGRLLAFGRGALDQLIERQLGSSHDLGHPACWSVRSTQSIRYSQLVCNRSVLQRAERRIAAS